MIFAILTLLSALSLAATAGWFSIVGFMAIYAGAPIYALLLGVVTECAKLVTTSWLYRNWQYADWRLKAPLLYFTITLMLITSIGVFGFLSKAHLEQTSGTLDNSAKIETLVYQINREKAIIADNEKVISQLDATVNSFLGKDRTDKSLAVRKSQESQRKKLQDNSDAAQKRIDTLSAEKFVLESEIRKLQLEVGPIRYIAELIYGEAENSNKNIESAVRIFTLLIVSTLDPLAVVLLIAANHALMRLKNVQSATVDSRSESFVQPDARDQFNREFKDEDEKLDLSSVAEETFLPVPEAQQQDLNQISSTPKQPDELPKNKVFDNSLSELLPVSPTNVIRPPKYSRILSPATETSMDLAEETVTTPWAQQTRILEELLGDNRHFIPKKLNEKEEDKKSKVPVEFEIARSSAQVQKDIEIPVEESESPKEKGGVKKEKNNSLGNVVPKVPVTLSWLNEFRR